MSEEYKQLINRTAWHVEDGYDEGERVRLCRACEFIQAYAPNATGDDRQSAVLDIGCGIDPLREWLPTERFSITGLDISPEAAAEARKRYDKCLVTDIESLWPVEPHTFDAVHAGAGHGTCSGLACAVESCQYSPPNERRSCCQCAQPPELERNQSFGQGQAAALDRQCQTFARIHAEVSHRVVACSRV